MSDGLSIPLHLAVHLVGLAAVVGLFSYAVRHRRAIGPAWLGLGLGALILAAQYLATGLVLTDGASWPVYARAVAYAGIAVGVAGQASVTGSAPVVVAIAPVSVHVAAGIAGLLAATSSLRGMARRGGLLALGIAAWATHDMLVRSRPEAAGWIAVIGSALVLWWVGTASSTSVRARLLSVITALVAFAVVVVAASTGTLFADQFRADAVQQLRAPVAALADDLETDWPREVDAAMRTTPLLLETIEAVGRNAVGQREAEVIRRLASVDLVVVLGRDGAVRGASVRGAEAPATWSAILSGTEQVEASTESRQPQVGRALLRAEGLDRASIAVFATAPVLPRSSAGVDERIGILVLARLLDGPELQERGADAAAQLVVLAGNELIESTQSNFAGDVDPIRDAILAGETIVATSDGEYLVAPAEIGFVGVPIRAAGLRSVGVLGDPAGDTARDLYLRSLVALLASLVVGAIASSALARPVRVLTGAVDRVARGELDSRLELDERDDEFGRLAEAFDDMTVALAARQQALQRAATTEADLRGRLQAVTDSMSDGLLATDRDGVVTSANPAAARLLGVPVEELVGTSLAERLRGRSSDDVELADLLDGVGRDEQQRDVQARLDTTDLEVAITTSPLRGSTGSAPIVGSVLVMRDVSREAELARARQDFVTNISHELRTPLTLIMAPVRQLERWRKSDDLAALQTEILNRGTARMHRLERELTEWAQVELDRFAAVTGVADLVEVRKRSVDLVRWQFPDREIRVKIARRLAPIGVSTEALQTILRELTHNAVLFSKHDAKRVDVAFRNHDDGVELSVRDRGIGMSEDTIARAFEPYWQLDPSERREFDGLGIGLTLAQRVAGMAGTTIQLTSRPGRGTTATVLLPRAGD